MELDYNDKILLHLRDKYNLDTKNLTEESLKLIEDVSNAAVEVYKSEMINRCIFPYAKTEENKVQYSLFRLMHFLEACSHDKKFLLEYDKWGKNSDLHEAFKKGFPKLGLIASLIRKRLQKSTNLTKEQLENNEEMSYWLLECHEHLTYQTGL